MAVVDQEAGEEAAAAKRVKALRAEMQEMDTLFRSGVLRQYVYLDLRGEIQRKRDHIISEQRQHKPVHTNYVSCSES